jgi:hypothetical protein
MKRFLLLFVLLLINATNIIASNILTIDDFLKSAQENDPEYKAIFHDTATVEGLTKSIEALYDLQLYGSAYLTKQPRTNQNGLGLMKDAQLKGYKFGGRKKIKETGSLIDISFNRTDFRGTMQTSFSPSDISIVNNRPQLSYTIAQPLLRDFMGKLSRMPLKRLEIQKKIATLSEKENEEKYFEEQIMLYYDWISLTLAIEPLKESYLNAQKLLEQVKSLYKNDAAIKSDLLQSEEAVLMYENALTETLYNWNQLGLIIYKKIGKEFFPATSYNYLPSKPKLYADLCKQNKPEVFTTNRALQIIEMLIKQYQVDKNINNQTKLPSLSVFGKATPFKETNHTTDSVSGLNTVDTTIGVELQMSFDKSDTKGKDIELDHAILKTIEELSHIDDQLSISHKNLVLKEKTFIKLSETKNKIVNLSKERLEIETGRYQKGKTFLRDVSDCRNQYVTNKINAQNHQIALIKLRVARAALNDELSKTVETLIGEK